MYEALSYCGNSRVLRPQSFLSAACSLLVFTTWFLLPDFYYVLTYLRLAEVLELCGRSDFCQRRIRFGFLLPDFYCLIFTNSFLRRTGLTDVLELCGLGDFCQRRIRF